MSRWTSGPSSSLRKCAAAVPPMPAPMMATPGLLLEASTRCTRPRAAAQAGCMWLGMPLCKACQELTVNEVRLRVQVNQDPKLFLQKLLSCFLTGLLMLTARSSPKACHATGGLNVCALRIVQRSPLHTNSTCLNHERLPLRRSK